MHVFEVLPDMNKTRHTSFDNMFMLCLLARSNRSTPWSTPGKTTKKPACNKPCSSLTALLLPQPQLMLLLLMQGPYSPLEFGQRMCNRKQRQLVEMPERNLPDLSKSVAAAVALHTCSQINKQAEAAASMHLDTHCTAHAISTRHCAVAAKGLTLAFSLSLLSHPPKLCVQSITAVPKHTPLCFGTAAHTCSSENFTPTPNFTPGTDHFTLGSSQLVLLVLLLLCLLLAIVTLLFLWQLKLGHRVLLDELGESLRGKNV
jgi:hypothetical protein